MGGCPRLPRTPGTTYALPCRFHASCCCPCCHGLRRCTVASRIPWRCNAGCGPPRTTSVQGRTAPPRTCRIHTLLALPFTPPRPAAAGLVLCLCAGHPAHRLRPPEPERRPGPVGPCPLRPPAPHLGSEPAV